MGALKDIVDLTKDLESRAKERRDMEIIHKIQQLAFSFQSSYADTAAPAALFNHALQRTRPLRCGCNPRLPRAGSLSLGRWATNK